MFHVPYLKRKLNICPCTGLATAKPTITVTSGPLPSRAELNTVIYNNVDHRWKSLPTCSLFDSKLCFKLNLTNE